jgi:hypothetical protein
MRTTLAVLALFLLPWATVQPASAAAAVTLTISEVDLDGPAVSPVTVTVTNGGASKLTNLAVTFTGPVGWTVHPEQQTVRTAVPPGGSVQVGFQIRVPEPRPGFVVRTFTATATYRGGDGAGTATATRTQRSGTALPNLAAAYNNVGVTDEADPTKGNFDGEGNSFSAQKLADVGITPGAAVTALGATFNWPSAAPGTVGNVAAGGQTVQLSGQGSRLAFLGSAAGQNATGPATVWYTDGTTSTGTFGFPNWSFQDPTAHGATLVASSDGRNRPDGYGNAGIAYRIFAHSIPLTPGKTVELVTLPSNGSIHIFDLQLVP